MPAPPSHRPALKPVCGYPRRVSSFSGVGSFAMDPVNIWDYERLSGGELEGTAAALYFGGAGDEVTLRDNLAAFERRKLRPRVLVDVAEVSAKATVLGTEIALPVL